MLVFYQEFAFKSLQYQFFYCHVDMEPKMWGIATQLTLQNILCLEPLTTSYYGPESRA